MFLLEIENILTKVNLDVPKHLLLILFGMCFVKGGGGLKEVEVANQMPLSWLRLITMVLKVVLVVVIMTRLLLKLATVVFGTVDDGTVGCVMLLVIKKRAAVLFDDIGSGRKSR